MLFFCLWQCVRAPLQKTGIAIRALGRLTAVTSAGNAVTEKITTISKGKPAKINKRDCNKKECSIGKLNSNSIPHPRKRIDNNKSNRHLGMGQSDACELQSKSLQRAIDKHVASNSTLEHDLNLKDVVSEQTKKTLSNENIGVSCVVGKNAHRPAQDSVRSRIRRLENCISSDERKTSSRSEHRRTKKR